MSARKRLVLDIALTAGLLVAFNPARTGIPVHEWVSIALLAPILLHLLVNWQWALRVASTFLAKLLTVSRLNFVVDVALFIASVAVMVSGFMVAPTLLAWLGIHFSPTYSCHLVHSWSADAAIALFALHGALHWRWALGVVRRMASAPAPTGAVARPVGTAVAAARSATKPATPDGRDRAAQAARERAAFVRGSSLVGVTMAAAVGVVVAVGIAGPLLVPHSAAARVASAARAGVSAVDVCPATGCTATKCHGSSGAKATSFYTKAQMASGMSGATRRGSKPASASARTSQPWSAHLGGIRDLSLPRPQERVALIVPAPAKRKASPAGTPGSGGRSAGTSGSPPTKVASSAGPGAGSGSSGSSSVASSRMMTCPVSGCTRSSCHASHGQSAAAYYH
jgi:hypothetical protein